MESVPMSIVVKNTTLAEQCKIGVVLTMVDGFKGCFFVMILKMLNGSHGN